MFADVREKIEELEARITAQDARIMALESVLSVIEDAEVDPMVRVVQQHREFVAEVQAKREQE